MWELPHTCYVVKPSFFFLQNKGNPNLNPFHSLTQCTSPLSSITVSFASLPALLPLFLHLVSPDFLAPLFYCGFVLLDCGFSLSYAIFLAFASVLLLLSGWYSDTVVAAVASSEFCQCCLGLCRRDC